MESNIFVMRPIVWCLTVYVTSSLGLIWKRWQGQGQLVLLPQSVFSSIYIIGIDILHKWMECITYFRYICKENQVVLVFTWWFFWIRLHCIEWRPAASIYLSIFTATFFTWCVGVFWGKISTAWKEWPVTNCLSRCRRSFAISFLSLATLDRDCDIFLYTQRENWPWNGSL